MKIGPVETIDGADIYEEATCRAGDRAKIAREETRCCERREKKSGEDQQPAGCGGCGGWRF